MTNAEAWKAYVEYTEAASANLRRLGLAAVAICWLLSSQDGMFSPQVLRAIMFAVIYFGADTVQYLAGAMCSRHWVSRREEELWETGKTIEGEYARPQWVDYPAFACLILKTGALAVSYAFVGWHVLLSNAGV